MKNPPDRLRFMITRGEAGLWYGTSPDEHGLLVAKKSFDDAIRAIPQALAELEKARDDVRDVKIGA